MPHLEAFLEFHWSLSVLCLGIFFWRLVKNRDGEFLRSGDQQYEDAKRPAFSLAKQQILNWASAHA